MLKKLNTFINYSILISILLTILGIVMIIFPKTSLNTFAIILAIFLIIGGIYLIILDIRMHENLIPVDTLFQGILSIIVGILMFIYPDTLSIIIPIALGTWFILSSIVKLRISLPLRYIDSSLVTITIILSILSIICGIVLIINPTITSITITLLAGITLVIYSISDIIDMIIFKKNIKEIVKNFKKNIKVIDME